MTRIIGKLLFFAIALNGIACACPGNINTSSDSHHEMHAEFDSDSNDCHGNGDDENCNHPETYQSGRANVAFGKISPQLEDDWKFSVVSAFLPGSTWPSVPPTKPQQPIEVRRKKHTSPITLKDRMLD